MFKQNLTTTAVWASMFVALGLSASIAVAEHPEPRLRTFAFIPLGTSSAPDWEGEDSIALTVLPDAVAGGDIITIQFTDDNPAPFNGTRWHSHPVHHAVRSGEKDNGVYFWLETEDTPEPPPVGTHTFSGTEGLVVVEGTALIQQCSETASGCSPNDNSTDYRVQTSGGTRFILATALFSQ